MIEPLKKPPGAVRASQRTARQAGFMLIEVLVSVLIFSVGVLALVGLQATMSQAQTNAKARSDAAYLASQITGQVWSDLGNINEYEDCEGYAPCKAWMDRVAREMPQGTGAVKLENGRDLTVTITWKPTDGGDEHQYETETAVIGPDA